ncbi:MAG: YgiQ family radical SAM protein [Bacteroidales bacterium]|nr:YgiQ family radical SAM protein [Bacteroidales bacterium]HOY38708.1 YgiQ family radical SAM protein [Bacteroidales bacterium]HQP05281.1 YgiQ family radical SAM protein [Bacteroidales bacterium]
MMSRDILVQNFLPTSKKEIESLGWDYIDVILFTGDAYIDHPAFGIAVIARVLQHESYRVAIIPQPNWQDDLRDFRKLGKPRLFFGVSAGNMDSMVNHYTANKRLRSNDAYTAGDKAGARPDYATVVYSKILKQLYPDTPIVLGGIEASMRRFAHYDYWQNKVMPSILIQSEADYLVYGMGEKPVAMLAKALAAGTNTSEIPQLAYCTGSYENLKGNLLILNSFEECSTDKKKYAANFVSVETESNKMNPQMLVQKTGNVYVVVNPHLPPISAEELDNIYGLPFTRLPHPRYRNKPPIPAYDMIKHSVTIHRGCFGGCSFCTISAHQGKFVSSRSKNSIIDEVKRIVAMPDFSGHISDLGGPSANMYNMNGENLQLCEKCSRPSCIFPAICKNLNISHQPLIDLYKSVAEQNGINHVSIGSGVRYDIPLFRSKNEEVNRANRNYLKLLIEKYISGRLKVAPEHTSEKVLKLMRKPSYKDFIQLKQLFDTMNSKGQRRLQLIPYFISSHPGCTISDMAELAAITADQGYKLEQVQDFTPTPMTLATVMYYTGIDPYTGNRIPVAFTVDDKKGQTKYFFWWKPENKELILKELRKLGLMNYAKALFK